MASTPLTLAETASVFGEMLTFRAVLERTTESKKRKALLASKVEDMINTVVRQIAFYTFERKVHEARKHGELTPDQLAEIWLEVQRESLGDGIDRSRVHLVSSPCTRCLSHGLPPRAPVAWSARTVPRDARGGPSVPAYVHVGGRMSRFRVASASA